MKGHTSCMSNSSLSKAISSSDSSSTTYPPGVVVGYRGKVYIHCIFVCAWKSVLVAWSNLFGSAHFLVRQVKQVVRGVDRRKGFKEFKLVSSSLLTPPTSRPILLVARRPSPLVIRIITSTATVSIRTTRTTAGNKL